MTPDNYLAACTLYRNDAEYLREWIEFHRLVGVERFFLYNNGSTDAHRRILEPYVTQELVSVEDWPHQLFPAVGRPSGGVQAFTDCVFRYRDASRWIAFIDVDEFLFSPRDEPLTSVLRDFETHPGVAVSRYEYGPSGHARKPDGLVIESYLERSEAVPDRPVLYKSVVQPARTSGCINFHRFRYSGGMAVNEHGWAVGWGTLPDRSPPTASRLRINHYGTRSLEEMQAKDDLWEASGRGRPKQLFSEQHREGRTVHDDAITSHVPALRKRLATAQPLERSEGDR